MPLGVNAATHSTASRGWSSSVSCDEGRWRSGSPVDPETSNTLKPAVVDWPRAIARGASAGHAHFTRPKWPDCSPQGPAVRVCQPVSNPHSDSCQQGHSGTSSTAAPPAPFSVLAPAYSVFRTALCLQRPNTTRSCSKPIVAPSYAPGYLLHGLPALSSRPLAPWVPCLTFRSASRSALGACHSPLG